MSVIKRVIKNPYLPLYFVLVRSSKYIKSDKFYLKLLYLFSTSKKLHLKSPSRYNEKLQWLKLYDRNPLYTTLVDKYEVKSYVSRKLGAEYVIPTLGLWDSFDQIDFDSLPSQFVLKCTHDSGGIVICKDKRMFDQELARKTIEDSLKRDYWLLGREWPYKDVPHRIIAEKYMEDSSTKELRDYKFFCFDGKVKAFFIATGRQIQAEPFFDFFDSDLRHLDLRHGHPNSPVVPSFPKSLHLMISFSEKLSMGLSQARVDFYEVNGAPYFGEITLFHHGGLMPFEPDYWDKEFGSWIQLPNTH